MPIYEYRCGSCGHQQEFLQKVSDAPLTECPQCKNPSLAKMVTAAGFQLKGSGWYATDFKSKPASATPAKKEAKEGGGSSSSDGKSEGTKDASASASACGTGCACH